MTPEEIEAVIIGYCGHGNRELLRPIFDSAKPQLIERLQAKYGIDSELAAVIADDLWIMVEAVDGVLARLRLTLLQGFGLWQPVDNDARIDPVQGVNDVLTAATAALSLNEVWKLLCELCGHVSKISVHMLLEQLITEGHVTADGSKPRLYSLAAKGLDGGGASQQGTWGGRREGSGRKPTA